LNTLKFDNGLNYDVMNNRCPRGKSLVVHRGLVLSYLTESRDKRPKCDKCGHTELNMQDFFYRCSEWSTCGCKYDLCRMCACLSCDPPVLEEKQKFDFHKCEMTRHQPGWSSGWSCDHANKNTFPAGKGERCESGMTNSNHCKFI